MNLTRRTFLCATAACFAILGFGMGPITHAVADTTNKWYSTQSLGTDPWGYWNECESEAGPCPQFDVEYNWSGGYDVTTFFTSPPDEYYADFQSQNSNNWMMAGGTAIGGQCCPAQQIGISPADFAYECYHGRSSCGQPNSPYSTVNDPNQASYAVTCDGRNDFCRGREVPNVSENMFQDGAFYIGACEVPVGDAYPAGHDCDQMGYLYDWGQ